MTKQTDIYRNPTFRITHERYTRLKENLAADNLMLQHLMEILVTAYMDRNLEVMRLIQNWHYDQRKKVERRAEGRKRNKETRYGLSKADKEEILNALEEMREEDE